LTKHDSFSEKKTGQNLLYSCKKIQGEVSIEGTRTPVLGEKNENHPTNKKFETVTPQLQEKPRDILALFERTLLIASFRQSQGKIVVEKAVGTELATVTEKRDLTF